MRSNTPNKSSILQDIVDGALVYKQYLVGRTFMYVFEGHSIEVIYRAKDFCHLTGVDTNSPAISFYKDAVNGRLVASQFGFSPRHPYDLCVRKVPHLKRLMAVRHKEIIVLENTTTNTITYDFGFTDLNFTLCLGQDIDSSGNIRSPCYICQSLRDEDGFSRSGKQYECNLIFSKQNDAKLYDALDFTDNKVELADLPASVKEKLSPNLLGMG